MSLLNQMLKDLERRNAGAVAAKPLSGEVRSAAGPRRGIRPWLWAVTMLLVSAAVAMAWWKMMPHPAITTMPAVVAPQQPTASVPPPQKPEVAGTADLHTTASTSPAADVAQASSPASDWHATTPASSAALPATGAEMLTPTPAVLPLAKPVADAALQARTPALRGVQPVAIAAVKQVSPQQRSDNLYRQAVSLLQQGRVAEAQGVLEQAVGVNPANHDARQLLVGVLVDSKRNAEAMALLQSGLEVAPEQSGFSMALARLQVESGGIPSALKTLEQGLPSAGDEAEYHAFMAALLQRDGRHDEAIPHYLTALRSNPAMPTWLLGIGVSLQAQGKPGDAAEAYRRARATGQLPPELDQFAEKRLEQLR